MPAQKKWELPTVIGDLGYLYLYAEMLKMVSRQWRHKD